MPANIALIGWGLLTAWGLASLTLDSPPVAGGAPVLNAVTSLASVVACLALLAGSRLGGIGRPARPAPRARHGALVWACAAIVAACSVANQLVLWLGWGPVAAAVVQIVSSFAYIGLMYLWFCAYAPHDPQTVENRAIWSTALCALVCLLAAVLPAPGAVALWVALPLLSAACLSRALRLEAGSASHVPETAGATEQAESLASASMSGFERRERAAGDASGPGCPVPTRTTPPRRGQLARSVASIALCSLVLALPVNLVSLSAIDAQPLLVKCGSLGGLALSAVLILWFVTSARRIELRSLFRILQPLAAVGLFLSALPSTACAVLGLGISTAGQWALYVFVWIYAIELRGQWSIGPTARFAASRAAFDIGGVLAAFAAFEVVRLMPAATGREMLPFLLFGAIALLIVISTLLPGPGGLVGTESAPGEEGLFPKGAGIDTWASARKTSADSPTGSSAQLALDGLIAARAHDLTDRFGLSEREAQILERLLKGYSTASIRNELAIAKGTVDTYIQRIYRKCDVHGRQELVELAEGRREREDSLH